MKLVCHAASAFAELDSNWRKRGPFFEAVKAAWENPGKVVECEWPTGASRAMITSRLRSIALQPEFRSYSIRIALANVLKRRGVFQIMRGAAR